AWVGGPVSGPDGGSERSAQGGASPAPVPKSPAHGGASAGPLPNSPGRAWTVAGSGAPSSTQICHPAGAAGQEGSGCQWGGGTNPGGGQGHPGAGLTHGPPASPRAGWC